VLSACSGGESDSEGHVWQEQTDMIDRADDLEGVLGTANEQQRQRIEEQSR
jgi:hypothetical protein